MIPAGVVVESDALRCAPWYRREPYLLFFPLGVALAWAGVLHWLLHAVGLLASFRPVFHAMTQIQGFMMCFAVGFLFTMIPRRTGSAPPATAAVAVGVLAPVTTVLAAWWQSWLVAQAAWLVLAATLIAFAVRRFLGAGSRRRPPNSFVWIPMSLAMGVVGSLMTAAATMTDASLFWMHNVGRGLLLQGMFIGLVLGVGSLAFPLMTRGEAPADSGSTRRDVSVRLAHVAGGAVMVASFFVEVLVSVQLAMALRALVIVVVLCAGPQLWRPPSVSGWNRRLVWCAGWLLPLGYVLAAIFPEHRTAGLHVTFIGGFALLALAVSTQVTLGHRGYAELMAGRCWQVVAIGVLMIAAAVARFVMELDRVRYFGWMGIAAAAFLAATLVWAGLLIPKMVAAPATDGGS